MRLQICASQCRTEGSIIRAIQCGYRWRESGEGQNLLARGGGGHIYIRNPAKGFGGMSNWRGEYGSRDVSGGEKVMQGGF